MMVLDMFRRIRNWKEQFLVGFSCYLRWTHDLIFLCLRCAARNSTNIVIESYFHYSFSSSGLLRMQAEMIYIQGGGKGLM